MSVLVDILPAAWRKWIYAAYAVIGLVLGAFQVGADQPAWLASALAVYAFVGTAPGLTAASNTNVPPSE